MKIKVYILILLVLITSNIFSSGLIVGEPERNIEQNSLYDAAKLTPANGGGASGGSGGVGGTLFIVITYEYLNHTLDKLETRVFEKVDEIFASTWDDLIQKAQEIYNSILNFFESKYSNVKGDCDVITK